MVCKPGQKHTRSDELSEPAEEPIKRHENDPARPVGREEPETSQAVTVSARQRMAAGGGAPPALITQMRGDVGQVVSLRPRRCQSFFEMPLMMTVCKGSV